MPVATGQSVARTEWLGLVKEDPHHFQIATFTAEELTGYSTANEDVVERAVFVTWSDEMLQ